MAVVSMSHWMGEKVSNDDGMDRGMLRHGQCWQVLIKAGRINTAVKVLHVDGRAVVLRSLENIDLIARYPLTEIEFLRRIDQ